MERSFKKEVEALRLGDGDAILVFNGRDGEWQASITGRKRPDQLAVTMQTRPQDHLPDIVYAFAPLKHARLDYMVQKAVELGASRLQPVLTRHTQVARVNGDRMRANVIEAAEQCGILNLADVADPVPLERFLTERPSGRRGRLIAHARRLSLSLFRQGKIRCVRTEA